MLGPNVNTVIDDLARSYSTITKVDAFAYACMNTSIGRLSPDPEWLGPMRQELALLNAAGAQWQQKKPTIWTPLLGQFTNYSTLFSGFAEVAGELGNDKDAWLTALSELSESLVRGANASRAAEAEFILQVNNLNNVEKVFDTSLNKAWAILADEEEKMMELAVEITALQDRVKSLETDLTGGVISSGKNYIQSSVTITYTLVSTAGLSIPYLSIAGLLFTVGKMAYDLIVTDNEINETIDKIVELRNHLSEEAQAAAMSKAIIHLIDDFDKNLLAVQRQLSSMSAMWTTENDKVVAVVQALKAGAVPRQMTELVSMPSADATWKTLSDFVSKLVATPGMGKPVTITTG